MNSPPTLTEKVADHFRRLIVNGELSPGTQLPSRRQISQEWGVSDRVALGAMELLAREGLVVSRQGAGVFVKARPKRRRLTRGWQWDNPTESPFAADMRAQGRTPSWRVVSENVAATIDIASRLGIEAGREAMRSRYVFYGDDEPVMTSLSYEPYEDLTRGTEIAFPERGPHAGKGVRARMLAIGIQITRRTEVPVPHVLSAEEASALGGHAGDLALLIRRTYWADDRPVEIADIVIPYDRYEVEYDWPLEQQL
ncbi:GntR family transcriptional regulator [Microtetraspora malaysiensis]|uniref:GntR family transcriptional regulator n=1 Tax=Microtetraspora malaysiensis TaxID=161358 RepID=A0ABW6T2Z8_9ACTN